MKALTVQQPWAWAIVHGDKDVENRTQPSNYRGPLAIHAGARWSDRGAESPLVRRAVRDFYGTASPLDEPMFTSRESPRVFGAIIGTVDQVGCHMAVGDDLAVCCSSVWGEVAYVEHGGRTRRDVFHRELTNPRPLDEPIPCRGALGLWTPPTHVLEQLEEALRG